MKAVINTIVAFLMYGIYGGMEMGSISIKNGLIALIIGALFLCLINRKKSAVSRKYNGQAHKVQTKIIHKNCTPCKGGMSSVL